MGEDQTPEILKLNSHHSLPVFQILQVTVKVAFIHIPYKEPHVTFSLVTQATFMESNCDRRFESHPIGLSELSGH